MREDRGMPVVLFLLFIIVPLVELWVIIQVGEMIGALGTVLALLAISLVGAALTRREGLKAWVRFRQALAEGRLPAEEVTDGALLLLAGALLLTPGFVTDGVGLALLAPPSRALINRGLRSAARRQFGLGTTGRSPSGSERPRSADDDVVDVEIVNIERNEDRPGEVPPPGERPGGS